MDCQHIDILLILKHYIVNMLTLEGFTPIRQPAIHYSTPN